MGYALNGCGESRGMQHVYLSLAAASPATMQQQDQGARSTAPRNKQPSHLEGVVCLCGSQPPAPVGPVAEYCCCMHGGACGREGEVGAACGAMVIAPQWVVQSSARALLRRLAVIRHAQTASACTAHDAAQNAMSPAVRCSACSGAGPHHSSGPHPQAPQLGKVPLTCCEVSLHKSRCLHLHDAVIGGRSVD